MAAFIDQYVNLIVWAVFFIGGSLLKYLFGQSVLVLELPPDLTLWVTGAVIAHFLSVHKQGGLEVTVEATPKKDELGHDLRYYAKQPQDPRPTTGVAIAPLGATMIWIIALVLCLGAEEKWIAGSHEWTIAPVLLLSVAYILAGCSLVLGYKVLFPKDEPAGRFLLTSGSGTGSAGQGRVEDVAGNNSGATAPTS